MTNLDLRVKRPLRRPDETEWAGWSTEAKVIADTIRLSGKSGINIDQPTKSFTV